MENQTYLQLVKDAFQFLFDKYNYTVAHHVAIDPFWNAQTYLQSDNLLLQIVNDWCLITLDLKPFDAQKPLKKQFNDFFDIRLILALLEVPEVKDLEKMYEKVLTEIFCEDSEWYNMVEKERGMVQMHLIAKIFEKYYEQILEIFSEEYLSDTIKKLQHLKIERDKNR